MQPRFYAPELGQESAAVTLPADEGEHLTRVLRLGVGDNVRVFNGRGLEWTARVSQITKTDVRVELLGAVVQAAEPRVRVTLAHAVLKGDKTDDVLRDATMLGVAGFRPLLSARTDVPSSAFASSRRLDRWRRIVVSSVKQCGRAVVPELEPPENLAAYLRRELMGLRLMFIEPGGCDTNSGVVVGDELRGLGVPEEAHVLVGPEGGWAPEEVALGRDAGWVLVTLGQRTWRADVAPLIAVGVLQFVWGDL